ncbi:MAG: hypothetical protein ACE5KE_10180 [Methanosarcinales archaeon]
MHLSIQKDMIDYLKYKGITLKNKYLGKVDNAEYCIEFGEEVKDGNVALKFYNKNGKYYVEIPDDIVDKIHLNADEEFEIDINPRVDGKIELIII